LLSTANLGWPRLVQWVQETAPDNLLTDPHLTDPHLTDDGYRLEHEAEVYAALQAFFAPKTKQEAYAAAQQRRIPLAPVNDARDLVNSPQLQARGFFVDVEHPELDTLIRYPGAPYALSETPWQLRQRPPQLGEHNAAIWGQELGLSPQELATLHAQGIM
jgi:crotonobetainyl-CoA:carnitine CoA-transferase CaiB-like acyl-CoA transferase